MMVIDAHHHVWDLAVTALARSLVAGLPGSEQAAVFGGTAARAYRIAGQETVGGMGAGSWR
jgi:predicted TIM-barrel fold metal-dependent hydrolase